MGRGPAAAGLKDRVDIRGVWMASLLERGLNRQAGIRLDRERGEKSVNRP